MIPCPVSIRRIAQISQKGNRSERQAALWNRAGFLVTEAGYTDFCKKS